MKRKILFINLKSGDFAAPFANTDYEILSSEYGWVYQYQIQVMNTGSGGTVPGKSKIIMDLRKWLDWADVVYVWFADLHTWGVMKLASILYQAGVNSNKPKFVVVIGGYEVDSVEGFPNYGNVRSWKRHVVRSILGKADQVIVPSKYLARKLIMNYYTVPTKLKVVPLGFSQEKFHPEDGNGRGGVLSVALADDLEYARMKGVDDLIWAAKWLPEIKFSLVGIGPHIFPGVSAAAPRNMEVFPLISQTDLIQKYQRAKVYYQGSYTESFGASLAEAMLCGCIPVYRRAGAMEEVVDWRGFGFENNYTATNCIKLALDSRMEVGLNGRDRIINNFSLERRRQEITGVIEEVCT